MFHANKRTKRHDNKEQYLIPDGILDCREEYYKRHNSINCQKKWNIGGDYHLPILHLEKLITTTAF